MRAKLISFSELNLPLPPYKGKYIVGIAQSNKTQLLVHIDTKYISKIKLGIFGEVRKNEQLYYFFPEINENEKELTKSKVAIITGSSKGIGSSIAIELARKGYDIVVNNSKRSKEALKVVSTIHSMGQKAIYIPADISDSKQVKKMIDKTLSAYGKIDLLVNNAGLTSDKKIENMSSEQWDKVISVNLTGAFYCTKLVIKQMLKQDEGKIINISSIVGQMGNPGQVNYSASKGGLIAFTKTLAKEYADQSITVNAIAPGIIDTDMVKNMPRSLLKSILEQIPLGRMGKPEEVAKLVCFLASNDANYITGQVFNINGGLFM